MTSGGGSLLLVCTGNVCRSPFMEHFLRARVTGKATGAAPPLFFSAGTRALAGEGIDPAFGDHLTELGIDSSGFRARQLEAAMVRQADLVLTADRHHRGQVLQLQPGAHRKVFTLAQASRLIGLEPIGSAKAPEELAIVLAGRRGRMPSGGSDDIADPFRRPPDFQESVVAQMLGCLESVRQALEGSVPVAQD